MPAISKIRLTNVVYEEGNKRYNDEVFLFDGHNGAVLLENGGGKTVLIQTALQAILPHVDFAERKIKHTLQLENAPAHIAIEWIHHDQPRRYLVTAVSLFLTKHGLDSLRYVYEYDPHDKHGLDHLPFVRDGKEGKRTAERGEMVDYYASMREKSNYAQTFQTIKEYKTFLETEYHIITSEWESIVKINSTEGGVEAFFNECKNTNQLFDRLLIPTVENAIVGHDEHLFADMFERQYTSFKNYKKLKHTLEENKRIEQQLEAYVATCKTEHDQHLSYIASKGKAKGIWEETLSQKKTSQLELEELNRKVEEWKKTNLHNKMKKASLEIQLDKATLHQLEAEYNQLLREQEEKQEQLRDQQQRYYSLKYSERKEKLTEQQQLYNLAIEELEKLSQTEEVYEVEAALEEVKRKLLGYYIKQIEMFEADKKSVDLEITQTMALLEDTNETVIKLSKDERASLDSLAKIAGTIEARKEDMERIKQQILANPKQETVMAELEKWQRRYQFLDEEIIHLLQQQKKLQSEKQTLSDAIEKRREEKVEIEKDRARLSSQITMISEAEAELIAQLVKTRPQWASIENVYLQQDSIEKRIIETEEQLKASRNDLLHQERIAYRFVDDYGKQDIFFSDSFLEQQLQSWKNQFDYVITGVEYVQHLSEAEQEARKHDHIWPLILVTTNKSKHKLMEKVEKIADRLQFPITVMTSEEAASNSHSNTWILPMHWQTNMNPEQFSEWKQQICEYAKEQTTLREKKESEVKEWNELLGAFQRSFEKYPHEFVNQVKEQLSKDRESN
ncbi:MAG: hypothetical protein LRY71_05545 [Bacillaceae bacterium]|nr:hypothetical protein [Bacillaceae bacterium]